MNFTGLYNYYERLVLDYISSELVSRYPEHDEDFFLDVACYSLTRLPARYIRHEIDLIYYQEPGELEQIKDRVVGVVDDAAEFINQREKEKKRS